MGDKMEMLRRNWIQEPDTLDRKPLGLPVCGWLLKRRE